MFMRMTVQVTSYFIPIVSHKDSFCHRGKSKLGIGLFIHELLREPLILHRRHDRFIVYQFKTMSLFSNRDSQAQSVYHLRRPRFPPSRLLLSRPDSIALNDRIKSRGTHRRCSAKKVFHSAPSAGWEIFNC